MWWSDVRLRVAWLVALQFGLLILAEADDGLMSLMGAGSFMLPTTILLLASAYAALMRGY